MSVTDLNEFQIYGRDREDRQYWSSLLRRSATFAGSPRFTLITKFAKCKISKGISELVGFLWMIEIDYFLRRHLLDVSARGRDRVQSFRQ
jgi:hypothetical protein